MHEYHDDFQRQRLLTLKPPVWVVHLSSVRGPPGTSLARSRPESNSMIPAPGAYKKWSCLSNIISGSHSLAIYFPFNPKHATKLKLA